MIEIRDKEGNKVDTFVGAGFKGKYDVQVNLDINKLFALTKAHPELKKENEYYGNTTVNVPLLVKKMRTPKGRMTHAVVVNEYYFDESELASEDHIPLDLPAEKILLNQLTNMEKVERMSRFAPRLEDKLIKTNIDQMSITRMKLGSTPTTIYDKFRHPITVKDAYSGISLNQKQYIMTLIGLMLLRILNKFNQ